MTTTSIIDTHCHLDFSAFDADRQQVLERAKNNGVSQIIIPATQKHNWEIINNICATDAGREGELIFRYIAQLCHVKSKPSKRLWINSLTDSAIRQGFRNSR